MENEKSRMTEKRYTVLIVDDEEEVVRIIMEKTDWASMGFRLAGYAHNGVEALEMAEEDMPDVVMTDIKMPYMDGLTLGRKLKEQDSKVKLVIFSGFDEFEYAKEAIKLEVEEYLLKPIDPAELREVFHRLKEHLDAERDERENIDKLQEYYLESLPMLQEGFFAALIEGRIPEEQLPQYLQSYQIKMEGPRFLVSIVHISAREGEEMSRALRAVQVRRMQEEQLAVRYQVRSLTYLRDIVLIVQIRSEEEITRFTDDMDGFCRMARRLCGVNVTAGIGTVCSRLQDLPQSYQGASRALSYRAIYGSNRAINIAEMDPGERAGDLRESELIQNIVRQIRLGDRDSLDQAVDCCVAGITEGRTSHESYRIFLLGLLAELTSLGSARGLTMDEILIDPSWSFRVIFQSEGPDQTREWLRRVTENIQEKITQRREKAANSFVERAVEYVEECYAQKDISIESVCRQLGVSAAYFSTVFKKETGKTFISYLTDYRMEKAVELILTTGDKTYTIADKVGYSDSNYFSYVFKKQYGLSPSKYRQEKLRARG